MSPPLRFGPKEWLGALGDLGTFVPICLALAAFNGLPPARTLLFTGAVYALAALFFRVPVPVQPLKAMAAIVIAKGLGMGALSAAGLWMGAILLALALSGKADALGRFFTRPIVKGIQLGVGLMLMRVGVKTLFAAHPALGGAQAPWGLPGWGDLASAFWLLVLPQVPLTLGNSVYATADAAREYFGEGANRVTPGRLMLSLGLVNLVAGLCGTLPLCHGSGGLTAHVRFGSRSAGSTLILGAAFILLGLASSGAAQGALASIPPPLLGAMLLYVGACHVLLMRGLKEKRLLAAAMGGVGLVTGNLAYALALGLCAEAVLYGEFTRS